MNSEHKRLPDLVGGRLLARNTLLNLAGQAAPLGVALATTPYVIHQLGVERFGVLSLAWVVLGYFSIVDLGLGRATTRFVAAAVGEGQFERVPVIVKTSLLFITALALVGALSLIALTPLITESVLNIPPHLVGETKTIFVLASAGIVTALLTTTLSGVLEAYQRFDLVNALRVPSTTLTYVLPAATLLLGGGLTAIVVVLVLKNFIVVMLYARITRRILPRLGSTIRADRKLITSLFGYGGWIALHNVSVGVLLNLERFLIGVLLTASAVSYYSAPYELISRAGIIPLSIMPVLFPAFSALEAIDVRRAEALALTSLRYLVAAMGVVMGLVVIFAEDILTLWLGSDFARSAPVLRVLAVGAFLSSLAWLAGTLLQGINRPRVVTLIHLIQVPLYVVTTWVLVERFGIEGAAHSWTLRILVSLALLLAACWRLDLLTPTTLLRSDAVKLATLLGAVVALATSARDVLGTSLIPQGLLGFASISTMGLLAWRFGLGANERSRLLRAIRTTLH